MEKATAVSAGKQRPEFVLQYLAVLADIICEQHLIVFSFQLISLPIFNLEGRRSSKGCLRGKKGFGIASIDFIFFNRKHE